ncbi:hypothetical protein WJX81_004929 [Elliptochloris bilobata]|uniref:D-isomer specific 2-hydroxyacid dehydrogenase NAD-binding domain-containing protein n=1 Tax=Elliptochloris bilobata TaxID=381761 RepID=A0AAW1QU17_9CHLO
MRLLISLRKSFFVTVQRRGLTPSVPSKHSPLCRAASRMAGSQEVDVKARVLVLSGKEAPELSVLETLPPEVKVVGIGKSRADFPDLSDADLATVDVLLACGTGPQAGARGNLQALWPRLSGLRWLHSVFAGLEHLMFPELADSKVVMTNAKGNFSHSIAEWALTACLFFAKDVRRLQAAKAVQKWEPYAVEELRNKTLGVVGYGDIGQTCARIARVFGMRILALRRRTELSESERDSGLKVFPPDQLEALMAASDYVVMALPHTPATDKLVGRAALAALQPHAVLVNIGRGKTLDEDALVAALQQEQLRGAALDVFQTEPLPKSSPLWDLPNVLLSPHSADRTATFQHEAVEQFVSNAKRYIAGQSLENIVDKKAGY